MLMMKVDLVALCSSLLLLQRARSFVPSSSLPARTRTLSSSSSSLDVSASSNQRRHDHNPQRHQNYRKKKYHRRSIPESERRLQLQEADRQRQYDLLPREANLWSFESLFPEPVLDQTSIEADLNRTYADQWSKPVGSRLKHTFFWGEDNSASKPMSAAATGASNATSKKVDVTLTQMVQDRVYGLRRTPDGLVEYDTSTVKKDSAVQFRKGQRVGRTLTINTDLLNSHAKQELSHGRVQEAAALYERAVELDRWDGRAYLGLSRCAQRRRDSQRARQWLERGLAASLEPNPFLLQALGVWEERHGGRWSVAEALYEQAVRAQPSHAAAWVSLALVRVRKLGRPVAAGRACLQRAVRELDRAKKSQSSYVYTTWGNLEKATDARKARELYAKAIEIDPKCSAAWLQLGVVAASLHEWDEAERCFTEILKFDKRNSRVLQAYALSETKRPDGDSRKAIGLFEQALEVNPRDAGVLQPYALYVAELGDLDVARELLRRGTQVRKRHAAVWQAWGVLETRHGETGRARAIFQEGIWACGQLTGGQSGGYQCARLWQAWGVLEAKEGDHAAARRCFSRALDANSRNVPAVTAWALMEEDLGNINDARMILERALRKFAPGSEDKQSLWRIYELMEQRLGNTEAARSVYQRATRETITLGDDNDRQRIVDDCQRKEENASEAEKAKNEEESGIRKGKKSEFEVVRWESTGRGEKVWMNDGAIEAKMALKKKSRSAKKP